MKQIVLLLSLVLMLVLPASAKQRRQLWPDGTPMAAWFSDTAKVDVGKLGRRYVITDYGVKADSMLVQTEAIQAVIDRAAADGGGVVMVPRGTFRSGVSASASSRWDSSRARLWRCCSTHRCKIP